MTSFGSDGWTRRRLLTSAGAAIASTSVQSWVEPAWAASQAEDVDDLFWDQAEPPPADMPKKRALRDWPLWWKQSSRPQAVWAPDGLATDDAHLGQAFAPDEFVLTAEVLRRALRLAHIPEQKLGTRVLFGIRAAQRVNSRPQRGTDWHARIPLAESQPDHLNPQCVLGVWNRQDDRLWTGLGSTVCNVAYLFGQAHAQHRDKLCNLLPAGVYRYYIGTHRNGSNSRQPGAFKLASYVAVQRNYDIKSLGFSPKDTWEFRGPDVGDNIHAAYVMPKGMPKYSSAGCQVVQGTVLPVKTRAHPRGVWRQFRVAAGLKADPELSTNPRNPRLVKSDEDGRRYTYLLLTARELRLAAAESAKAADLEKLRRGSVGRPVKALQQSLGLKPTGVFDFKTQRALIQRQLLYFNQADGVMTRARLKWLELPETLFD